jgi:Domain of unknown function (DUF3597)
MSIFGNIMSSIFSHAKAQPAQAPSAAPGKTSGSTPSGAGGKTSAPAPVNPSGAKAAARPQLQVDVAAVLTELAGKNKEKLDWRHSIVDMMKLLNLDSSLSARKELAKELNYTGQTKDTAAMNIWLHKQVMIKLAENGGKVPDSLKV